MIKKIKIKIINNKKGKIIKFLNFKKKILNRYGEIYFSEVKKNYFKGWKFHKNRNQILTIASGTIIFSFKKSPQNKPKEIKLSYPRTLYALFIPKKTYYSFRCISKKTGIIINLIDEIIE
tara:strand:+ start:161 stop:520 length:360 start_codon:yes stop_codon:yes gene_type:complete